MPPDPTAPVPAGVTLSDAQREDLATLLVESLPPGNITWLAQAALGREVAREVGNELGDKRAYVRAVIELVYNEGAMGRALTLLQQESTRNGRLVLGLRHVLAGHKLSDREAYQRFVNDYEPFLDPAAVPRVTRTVCAIALGNPYNEIHGSGFLIGADLVMTNFHVVEPYLEQQPDGTYKETESGDQIFCFFDYIAEPTPVVPPAKNRESTLAVTAAKQWFVHGRSALPGDGTDQCLPPANKEYDYAVIRLSKAVGRLPARLSGGAMRGWLPLPEVVDVLQKRRVMVFQHPGRAPQQFDVGDFVQVDPSETRVWYRVSTAKGSSGGAAVDRAGTLFALHNAEVKRQDVVETVNQGVRIDLIADDLKEFAPACLAGDPPTEAPLEFWSLSDDITAPRPIIGRKLFREYVDQMMAPTGPRVMLVTGPPFSGVQFSTKLLRRTVGSQTPVVVFTPQTLSDPDFKPRQFARVLADQLGLIGTGDDPAPEQPNNETSTRWVRRDLSRWLARRLEATQAVDRARFPAWVVLNTVQPQSGRLLWADGLKECVAALAGVPEPGEPQVDLVQLRWLFLGSAPDGLRVAGVPRLDDDLAGPQPYEQEFAECLQTAWLSVDKESIPRELALRIARKSIRDAGKDAVRLKVLADVVRNLVTDAP